MECFTWNIYFLALYFYVTFQSILNLYEFFSHILYLLCFLGVFFSFLLILLLITLLFSLIYSLYFKIYYFSFLHSIHIIFHFYYCILLYLIWFFSSSHHFILFVYIFYSKGCLCILISESKIWNCPFQSQISAIQRVLFFLLFAKFFLYTTRLIYFTWLFNHYLFSIEH